MREFACHAADSASVFQWQETARPELQRLLGLDAIAASVGKHTPVTEMGRVEEMDGFTRQRCSISTEPHHPLPFWYLRPGGTGPFPLALLPHGHDRNGMDSYIGLAKDEEHAAKIRAGDRDIGLQALRRGFAVISPGTRGQAGVGVPDLNNRHGGLSCRSQMIHAVLAGRTANGERVWDMMRLIDWTETRPEIDTSTVLLMGNSGGGIVTLFTAAVDQRVSIAVPSCSYCTLVSPGGLLHHCDCHAVPGLLRFGEIWDVAGLIAPRRLCIVNGREDPYFPLAEVDRAVEGARRIYAAAGVSERFEHHYGPAGHRLYADKMWPCIEAALGLR